MSEQVQEIKLEEVAPLVSTSAEAVAADLVRRVPPLRGVSEVEVIAALVSLNTPFPQGLDWIIDDPTTVLAMIQASPKGWDEMVIGRACKAILDVIDAARAELKGRFAEEVGGIEPGVVGTDSYKEYEDRLRAELGEQGEFRRLTAEVNSAIAQASVSLELPLEELGLPEEPKGWAAKFRSTAQVIAIRAGRAFYIPTLEEEKVPIVTERPGWQTEPILRKDDPEIKQLWVVKRLIETKMGKDAILTRLAALGLGPDQLKTLLKSLKDKAKRQEEQCRTIEERAANEYSDFRKALADMTFVEQLIFRITDFIFPETAPVKAKS